MELNELHPIGKGGTSLTGITAVQSEFIYQKIWKIYAGNLVQIKGLMEQTAEKSGRSLQWFSSKVWWDGGNKQKFDGIGWWKRAM